MQDESTFVKDLKTGDLVFFDSESVIGLMIRMSGPCLWNHVGMIVRYPTEDSPAYVWESTDTVFSPTYPGKDYFVPAKRTGVLLTPLQIRLDAFAGSRSNPHATDEYTSLFNPKNNVLGVCRLHVFDSDALATVQSRIRDFILREHSKKYEASWWPVILSWWDGWNVHFPFCKGQMNEEDTSRYFCSELIAETLFQSEIWKKRFVHCTGRGMMEEPSSELTVKDLQDVDINNKYRSSVGFFYSKIEKFGL